MLRIPSDADPQFDSLRDGILGQAAKVMPAEEIAQRDRFKFDADRVRFAVCRSAVRRLLAGYLGAAPESLAFRQGEFGKPFLADPGNMSPSLQFNLSHSRRFAVLAVSLDQELGIDVESREREVDALQLGKRVFTTDELGILTRLDNEACRHTFFQYWTAKEAILKATGHGLSVDPREIEVALPVSGTGRGGFSSTSQRVRGADWALQAFIAEDEYQISLAVCPSIKRDAISLRYFDFKAS